MENKMKDIELEEIYTKNNFLSSLKYGGLNPEFGTKSSSLSRIKSSNIQNSPNFPSHIDNFENESNLPDIDTTLLKRNENITNAGLKRVERKIEKLQELMSSQILQSGASRRDYADSDEEMAIHSRKKKLTTKKKT